MQNAVEIDEARTGLLLDDHGVAASPVRRLRRDQADRGDDAEREHRDCDAGADRATGAAHLRYGRVRALADHGAQQAAHRESVRAQLFGPGGHAVPVCPLAAAPTGRRRPCRRELTLTPANAVPYDSALHRSRSTRADAHRSMKGRDGGDQPGPGTRRSLHATANHLSGRGDRASAGRDGSGRAGAGRGRHRAGRAGAAAMARSRTCVVARNSAAVRDPGSAHVRSDRSLPAASRRTRP